MALEGYIVHLEKQTERNSDFRKVLYTGKNSQLVLMSLLPGEEIGEETHEGIDQFFRFESGVGKVVISGVAHAVHGGDGAVVPAGAKHNVVNASDRAALKFYTVYSPPEHADRAVRRTKEEAVAMPEEYDGKPTERP